MEPLQRWSPRRRPRLPRQHSLRRPPQEVARLGLPSAHPLQVLGPQRLRGLLHGRWGGSSVSSSKMSSVEPAQRVVSRRGNGLTSGSGMSVKNSSWMVVAAVWTESASVGWQRQSQTQLGLIRRLDAALPEEAPFRCALVLRLRVAVACLTHPLGVGGCGVSFSVSGSLSIDVSSPAQRAGFRESL